MSPSRNEYILGVNYSGQHDSSIALFDNRGKLVFAVSEERLSRVKNDGRFPSNAIDLINNYDVIKSAVPYSKYPENRIPKEILLDKVFSSTTSIVNSFPNKWHINLKKLPGKLVHYNHHLSHAAAGYYFSPIKEATILVIDYGAGNSSSIGGFYKANSESITPILEFSFCDYLSPCALYSDVTAILGFIPNRHEGKITGLSARGNSSKKLRDLLMAMHYEIQELPQPLYEWSGFLADPAPVSIEVNPVLADYFRNKLADYCDADIARTAQNIVEEQVTKLIIEAKKEINLSSLILSGGIFSNVALNRRIKECGISNIFICPPMGDEGLSVGAGYLEWLDNQSESYRQYTIPQNTMFLGSKSSNDSIGLQLNRLGVNATKLNQNELIKKISHKLSDGNIIAIVRGKEEFGPRALGNRSILAAAKKYDINSDLNKKLNRTEFMPFAPIIREDKAVFAFIKEDLCGTEISTKFMTICVEATDDTKKNYPAVVHVDGTCRPQLVYKNENPFIYKLLGEYERVTRDYILINTSFNIHNEPIVSNGEDALKAFFTSKLDVLVLGDYLIESSNNPVWQEIGNLLANDKNLAVEKAAHKQALYMFGNMLEQADHLTAGTQT